MRALVTESETNGQSQSEIHVVCVREDLEQG